MKVLALEPYYGGSHKAFLDGWSKKSRHDWTLLTLPAYKWKWRMRHSAVTFSEQSSKQVNKGQTWDIIFCSDMLNLGEFLGLSHINLRRLPVVAYFHENQLTYPVRFEDERDYQFAMTNMTTALAAKEVWFNSKFHRDSFINALFAFVNKMPDYQPTSAVKIIEQKSRICCPGIEQLKQSRPKKAEPVRILFAARWEHDKNAEDFFKALKIIKRNELTFRLDVIGQHFRDVPEVFRRAKQYFAENINRWGYQQERKQYENALLEADILVSTANHEFFGISIVEAIAAGAYPLLPERLAYPEILQLKDNPQWQRFFYDGTINGLAATLTRLIDEYKKGQLDSTSAQKSVERFYWNKLVKDYDDELERLSEEQK